MWETENFFSTSEPVMNLLRDFLNEIGIEEFHIIRADEDYIEIIYKQP